MRIPNFRLAYATSTATNIMRRDISESHSALKQNLHKSTMVLSGSVLECALVEYLKTEPRAVASFQTLFKKRKKRKPLKRWTLHEMLKVAKNLKLIRSETFKLSDLLRDYRNLIHPSVEIRARTPPTKQRAERSLSALIQALQDLESSFQDIAREVIIIDIRGEGKVSVNNPSTVRKAITDLASSQGYAVKHVSTHVGLKNLFRKPPKFVTVFNAHGEVFPLPRSGNWQQFLESIGKAIRDFGLTLVSLGGYPFYYYSQGGHLKAIEDKGLNRFLSIMDARCDCMNTSKVEFTSEGKRSISWANMKGLPIQFVAWRCARWTGVKPERVFLKQGKLYGASEIKIGRGRFLQIGIDSTLGGVITDPLLGDTILGNLATAFAISN